MNDVPLSQDQPSLRLAYASIGFGIACNYFPNSVREYVSHLASPTSLFLGYAGQERQMGNKGRITLMNKWSSVRDWSLPLSWGFTFLASKPIN